MWRWKSATPARVRANKMNSIGIPSGSMSSLGYPPTRRDHSARRCGKLTRATCNRAVRLARIRRRSSVTANEPGRSSLPQSGRQGCRIQTLRELVVDVAQRHPQVVANGRKLGRAQLLVDRHQIEIGLAPGFADLEGALGRVHADEAEPAHQLAARLAPRLRAERGRNRITVEYRKNEVAQHLELPMPVRRVGA